jgi:hypothetical protein
MDGCRVSHSNVQGNPKGKGHTGMWGEVGGAGPSALRIVGLTVASLWGEVAHSSKISKSVQGGP